MKSLFATFLVVAFLIYFPAVAVAKKPLPQLQPEQKQQLSEYLRQHWVTPEEYLVSKFKDHNIVFVGEYHRIKHDVHLIQNVIPLLYKAGVYNLGMEFGINEDQKQVDKLITAENYNEDLARSIMFDHYYAWGYKEYEDIYRAAWRLNRSLPPGSPKFRIVNLNYKPRYKFYKTDDKMTEADWNKMWWKGSSDTFMAAMIMREFVNRKEKALIYAGNHHAFTRYQQPRYDFKQKKLDGLENNRMGNLVYAKIGDQAFTIMLHCPWNTKTDEKASYPAGGVIDAIMAGFDDTRVGFDVKNTPFGQLRDDSTYYSIGHNDFKFEDFCDGYIYQRHFSDYDGCAVDAKFINERNFQAVLKELSSTPDLQQLFKRPSDVIESIEEDADMKSRFRDLK